MAERDDNHPFPEFRSHPELIETYDALTAGTIGVDEAWTRLQQVVSTYLWEGATASQSKIVGAMLCGVLFYPHNLQRAIPIVRREWEASRGSAPSPKPIEQAIAKLNAEVGLANPLRYRAATNAIFQRKLAPLVQPPTYFPSFGE